MRVSQIEDSDRGPEGGVERRRSVRLPVPKEARIRFALGAVQYEMDLVDLSLEGAGAEFTGGAAQRARAVPLEVGQRLKGVTLVLPRTGGRENAQIDESIVRRTTRADADKGFRCGIEFTQVQKDAERWLTGLIYALQRRFLRRRLVLS